MAADAMVKDPERGETHIICVFVRRIQSHGDESAYLSLR
jgi:hypothetical protein